MDQAVVRPPVTVDAPMLRARPAEFVALLRDAVADDASVGFVQPLWGLRLLLQATGLKACP